LPISEKEENWGKPCDAVGTLSNDNWGRRRERQKIREKPKGPLRMTGGKQVDVLRSGPT